MSCVSDNEPSGTPQDEAGAALKIYVAAPSSEDQSRVAITPDESQALWSVEWEDGDALGLCSSGQTDLFTVDVDDTVDGAYAFNGSSSALSARAIYPYSASALSGDSYSFEIGEQICDMDSPLSSLGEIIPLISSEMVDLEQTSPTALMLHIGAALKINLNFSGLDSEASYLIENVTLHNVPTQGSFSISGSAVADDFLATTTGDLSLSVANSPKVEANQIYTLYSSIIPFAVASNGAIELSVTLSSTVGSEQSTITQKYYLANSSGSEVEFARAQYHTLNVNCPLEQGTEATLTATMDGSELSSYTTSESAIDVEGVSFAIFNVGNYSQYGTPPIQFKASLGYLYNLTSLNGLSKVAITYLSSKKCGLTLYVGAEKNPTTTEVTPTQTSDDSYTTLTYAIPSGTTHLTLANKSTSAAYANTIVFTYSSLGETDSLVEATEEESPYSTENAPRWGEIPEFDSSSKYQYVTHTATLNNSVVRNYSLCFDNENRAAAWVAFPYHDCYTGDTSRTEAWGFDPYISEALQANLSSSYSAYNGNSYDRGHQIGSADRLATYEMNAQTFYYSNMTPQNSSVNSGQWSSLESKVRNQVCSDTLYVVTGADLATTLGSSTDADGNECPIPGAYYKVMLRTKSGSSGKAVSECSADELQAIGYWVENVYTGVLPDPVSVSEIEAKTGFTFFPTVPEAVKESCDSSLWTGL